MTKEKEKELEDFGARMYDPAIARWWSVDPMAEKYPMWPPYAFCFNNPLNFIDEDGREGVPVYFSKNSGYTYWPKLKAH